MKSIVKKVEKVKVPPINKKIHDSKKRTLPKPATVTRPRSPSPLGEDPQISVSEVEFESPVKIEAGDPEYVPSIESLAEKARKAAPTHETSPVVHVTPVLKVSLPIEDEAAMAADVLQNIVESMSNVYHTEPEGQQVTGYTSVPTPENKEDTDNRIVIYKTVVKENTENETEEKEVNAKVGTRIEKVENDHTCTQEKNTENETKEKERTIEKENTVIESKEVVESCQPEKIERQKEESEEEKMERERLRKEKKERRAERKRQREAKQKEEESNRQIECEVNVQEEIMEEGEEVTSEELLRKQLRILNKEERKRKREAKKLEGEQIAKRMREEMMMEEELNSIEKGEETEPIVTRKDIELEEIENEVQFTLADRITLDVGGRHFATTRGTLMNDGNSKLYTIAKEGKKHYFIDRDGAHFRYILNFLRENCNLSMDVLPRENRYLLELKYECIYYKLEGLRRLVEARLDTYASLGLAF